MRFFLESKNLLKIVLKVFRRIPIEVYGPQWAYSDLSESPIIKYIITPNRAVQVFDPNTPWPWWKYPLQFLRLVRRPRMALIYSSPVPNETTVVCHPDSVPAVQKYLAANKHNFTVRPNLQALKGGQ